MGGDGSGSPRGSKRLKTTMTQGPRRRLQGSEKPRKHAAKVTLHLLHGSLNFSIVSFVAVSTP